MSHWRRRSYLVDWVVLAVLLLATVLMSDSLGLLPVFERDFSPFDPSIDYPRKPEQIESSVNYVLSIGVPAVVVVATGLLQHNWVAIHHNILVLGLSSGFTGLITNFLKSIVGSLRPDFLARCKWDIIERVCTGNPVTIKRGRQSFPSGHSSSAFGGMTFLALWFAGMTGVWCFSIPSLTSNYIRSRALLLVLGLLPFTYATFVAITRLEDNRHRPEDLITGALIGITMSTIIYHAFWPSPFSAKTFAEGPSRPRNVYKQGDEETQELLISQ